MTRPFCLKNLHTRCRYDASACDCLCHKDNGSGISIHPKKLPPWLELADTLLIRGIN